MLTNQYKFLVLDIETSTLTNDLKEPLAVWLSYGYINLYDRNGKRIETNYFREWEELRAILIRYSLNMYKRKIFCFVHNLGYEFDFLIKNISRPSKMLSNSTHGVISGVIEGFTNIEFRCTYKLSGKSLRSIGNDLGFPKLESEYRFITPLDKVTKEEKEYCIRDCDVVAEYVSKTLLPEFQLLTNIPLTKTGRVRKKYNDYYNQYIKYNPEPEWDLYPDEDCYEALNNAFAGGICISNPFFTAIECKDVYSYDISSSYPFAQLSEQFPYSIKREYNPKLSMLKEKFWIAKIKFFDITSKYNWQWLSISKMQDFDNFKSKWFNGKLVTSPFIVRTVTNVDYEMICKTYTFKNIEVLEFYHCPTYGDLPKPYIDTICDLAVGKFKAKQECASIPENDERFIPAKAKYTLVKNDFNSIYGMTVQKILQDEYSVDDNFVWCAIPQEYKKKEGKHLKRNFLFGIYTTAYARRNLLNAIIYNCPETFVYCDTDSIKYIGGTKFVDTNKELPDKFNNIDGVKTLGRFECDEHYKQFITYGAKKYAYTLYNDDNVYLTVAGLPKFYGDTCEILYNGNRIKLDNITKFVPGLLFKDCKLGKKYMVGYETFDLDEDMRRINIKDVDINVIKFLKEHKIKTNGGVALYDTSYYLNMENSDIRIINEHRRILKLWLNRFQERSSIPLQEYLNLTHLTTLSLESVPTAKHTL